MAVRIPAAGLDDLGGFAGLDFAMRYEPGGVELRASAHKGDANLDAQVDVLDLAIFANHFGWSGGAGGAPIAPAGRQVPEPAAPGLLAAAAMAMLTRRKP